MGLRPRKSTPYSTPRGGFYQPPLPGEVVRTDKPPVSGVTTKPTTGPRSLAETLLARHRGMGIPEIAQPFVDVSDAPVVPEDITSLAGNELSALYGRLDAFAGFVGYRLAEAEVRKLDAGHQLKDLDAEKTLFGLLDVKKGDITRKRMEVFLDKDLVAMRTSELYHTAEVKLLKARYEGIERTIRVLSREQSRREPSSHGHRNHNRP